MGAEIKVVDVRKDEHSKRNYNSVDYDVQLPDQRVVTWSCVEGPDIAVVLAVDGDRNALMKREWRLSQKREVLEIVSGKIDHGEEPLACATRELKEEIGVTADKLIFLGAVTLWNHATVRAHIFLAQGLKVGDNKPDQDEFLKLERVPYDHAVETVTEVGTNAQTLLALFLAEKFIGK